ncbi:hypothetical protein ACFWAY_31315 [Rhodococcus sp. NPDC059968]|uniref:hypothetical protein n=1 Tax=Rhodococcus sp. NPDC059968 TaxID=3347017 RepID=UPI00366C818E
MMQRRSRQQKTVSADDLTDRLPQRFYDIVLDRAKPFCGIDEYAVDLDDWVRAELGLPARHGVRYDGMTLAIMEAIEIATIADWFRYSMTGTPQDLDGLTERLHGHAGSM